MKRSIRSHLLLVLVVLTTLLTACDTVLEMGIVPTSTPIPTSTPTPTPSPAMETYTNEAYGFTFEYLSTWTLTQEPHVIKLNQDTLTLRIGYRWATESADVTGGRTGMPAGDFIYGDKVFFLDQVIPAEVLEYQRKDKMVLYGGTSLVETGDLVFCIWLEDLDGTKYDELDIPKELQAEVKGILESFTRIEATGRPLVAAATPTAAGAPTTAPAATTAPTATPEPTATAEARSSEIIPLGMTWNQYTNYRMGFSIKVPVTMVSLLGACKWNEKDGDRSFRPDPALVPVEIFEDVDSVYIAPEYVHELSGEWKQANGSTCFAECNQVPNSLALLQDPERPWFSAEMWKIVAAEVHSDDELEGFIKSRYGSGCSLGEKEASGQDGVYRVRIQGDGKDLSETQCPLNYATVVKYYPEGNKVIAWNLGQGPKFVGAVDYSVQHDQEMVDSFRFLTETPAAYDNDEYGFSFRYPASWTVEEVVGETRADGIKLADAVILTQGKFKIVVRYLHKSGPAQFGWDGSLGPALHYEEGVLGEKMTVMGIETHKRVWTYNERLKAVFVQVIADAADLVLYITLADSSVASIRDVEAETVPDSAIAALDQILATFEQIPAVPPTETPVPSSAPGQIAFMSNLHLQEEGPQIYVMNADGSNPQRLTSGRGWQGPLSWSPDGKYIASTRGGDIYVMDADGSNPRNLTNYAAIEWQGREPAWSPDGQHIAFSSNRAGRIASQAYAMDIYVMNADGSDPHNLTDSTTSDASPAWSPDGSHIAFQSDRDGNWEIYVMAADGSNPRNLTNHESYRDASPAWSPDGRYIAFDSDRDGDREIYVMEADGSNLSRLTDHEGMDGLPTWSPDGRYIAFQSDRDGGSQEIYIMEVESGNVQRLTEHKAFKATWSPLP